MSKIDDGMSREQIRRRLAAEADLQGNADGVASEQELEALEQALRERASTMEDIYVDARVAQLDELLEHNGGEISLLDPHLRSLPEALRRLALEIDHRWGDSDGEIELEEIDRVASYYLAALPFFAQQARNLLALSEVLGFEVEGLEGGHSVAELQVALADLDRQEELRARPFRKLFREALELSEIPGMPEMFRDVQTHNPRWHSLSILEHTVKAVEAVEILNRHLGVGWREAGAAMLLHDIGKLLERQIRGSGDDQYYSFWDHEENGADWLEQREVSKEVVFQIRYHSVLRERSVEEMIDLSGGDALRLARMLLVYVADQVAKGNTPDQVDSFRQLYPKIRILAEHAEIDGEALLNCAELLRKKWFPDI